MPSEGCRPKVKTVPLSRYGKSTFMYWPDCVMLDQCSGCCTSDLLECQPVFTLIHPINVSICFEKFPKCFLCYPDSSLVSAIANRGT